MVRLLGGVANEEEARASFQQRLTTLYKIMFWAFVTLIASQWVMYELLYPPIKPSHEDLIYVTASCGLVVHAGIWRGILVRRTLSVRQLDVFDMFFSAGSGLLLGAAVLFTLDFPPSHYVSMLWSVFVVFTRAIMIPSTGRWTALTATATLLPLVASAAVIAITGVDVIVPGGMFFVLATIYAAVSVLLATMGSRVIYGLRQTVSAAMQLGQYTLDEKIGEGGMGVVYRAHHVLLRRPTAIKLLAPDRVGADNLVRFEREVQHMSQLSHPNTVAVFDYGRSPDGVFYYAMEYLGGGIDLERLVRQHGPQPTGRVASILAQVCGALQEAHDGGIIHRDIKPANIILCERGGMPDVAKVVDFGLVKEIAGDGATSQQAILGTPAYVAPEAITDPDTVGPASDLYALGAVGYFLITGRRVFEGPTAIDVCVQQVSAPPRPPSEVSAVHISPELEAIVMRCLQKQPDKRFASANELAAALRVLPVRDWSEHDASMWWSDYRRNSHVVEATPAPGKTMPIDLGDRNPRFGVKRA